MNWWVMVSFKIFFVIVSIIYADSFKIDGFLAEKAKGLKGKVENSDIGANSTWNGMLEHIKKNYKLIKNHTNAYLRTFDLFQHLQLDFLPGKNFKHDRYLSYQEQCNWMSDASFNEPTTTLAFSLGYTHQGNEICTLFINVECLNLPLIWLDGNMDARAWLSSASLLSFADYLIFSKEPEAVRLRTSYRFIIVPNLNPDGYEYTRTTNRMWVKNRRKVSNDSSCIGVNLNRNFDTGTNVIEDPCSDSYGGKSFSELETKAVLKAYTTFKNIIVSLSFHMYGQMWLVPYACCSYRPQDFNEMRRVAHIASRDIFKNTRALYSVEKASDILGYQSGTTFDWSKMKMNSRYSYGVALRPYTAGDGGFLVSPKWIIPTGEDILYGVKSVLYNAILKPQKPPPTVL